MKKLNEPTQEAAVEAARQEAEDAKLIQPVNGQRFWLVTYATTNVADEVDRTLTDFGVVEAATIKEAEDVALRNHASEGFAGDKPYDNESGQWVDWGGFRAFELSEKHAVVDACTILWIERICEIDAADARVLIKHLHRAVTYEQGKAEKAEQLRLRGVRPATSKGKASV